MLKSDGEIQRSFYFCEVFTNLAALKTYQMQPEYSILFSKQPPIDPYLTRQINSTPHYTIALRSILLLNHPSPDLINGLFL